MDARVRLVREARGVYGERESHVVAGAVLGTARPWSRSHPDEWGVDGAAGVALK